MNSSSIAFIGAGNMAGALVRGLVARGVDPQRLRVSDRDPAKLEALQRDCGVTIFQTNVDAARGADLVLLAVKPQGLRAVAVELAPVLAGQNSLLLSIAAGIGLDSLQRWTHAEQAIIRCMPNTPALVLAGASALFANARCSEAQKQLADAVLGAVGSVSWLAREADMDAVTALSGSGPAYFFLLMEAMQEAGIALGLPADTARTLCLQTAFGAARLALESDVGVDELRRRVTSPGGTTEAALRQFNDEHFKDIVQRALARAASRSQELARQSAD